MSFSLPPEPTPRLTEMNSPDEPAPWLHPHPSEQGLRSYYKPVRQRTSHRYSMPSVAASARSLSPTGGPTNSPVNGRSVSTLAFSRSVQEPQTRLTSPLRRTPPGQYDGLPPGSSRGRDEYPRFLMSPEIITTLQRRHPPGTPAEYFWHVFLIPPDASRAPFPCRSPRRPSTNAAQGGLTPAPEGRRPRANHPPSLAQHRHRKNSPTSLLLQRS